VQLLRKAVVVGLHPFEPIFSVTQPERLARSLASLLWVHLTGFELQEELVPAEASESPWGSAPNLCKTRMLSRWLAPNTTRISWRLRSPARQNHQAAGNPGGPRSGHFFRALAALRSGNVGRPGRRLRTLHHGSDPASLAQAGPQVHPPRQPLPGQRRRPERTVMAASKPPFC